MPRQNRHYLLYARQNWRDTRILLALFALFYLGWGAYSAISHRTLSAGVTFIVAGLGMLLLAPLLYLYSRRSYVDVGDGELEFHMALRRATIPYTEVEKVRLDTLRNLWERPEFKKRSSGTVKRLYDNRAVCLRLRDEDGLQRLRRRLGPRHVMERELILAVTEAEDAYGQVKARLQARRQRPAEEEGGSPKRRRGRRRRR